MSSRDISGLEVLDTKISGISVQLKVLLPACHLAALGAVRVENHRDGEVYGVTIVTIFVAA